MNNRPVSRWLAGAIAIVLVLSFISTLNAAQATPTMQAAHSTSSSRPAQQQAALPAKPDKAETAQTVSGLSQSTNHAAQPNASGVTYTIAVYMATPISGTTDIGNHCDDCTTLITFPFPVTFYGAPRTIAYVSSNGNLQFSSNNSAYTNTCLPNVGFSDAIYLYWDDLITTTFYPSAGIYTATVGSAPNRQYVIEWRAYQAQSELFTDEEIIFSESSTTIMVAYGNNPDRGISATAGVQEGDGSGLNSHTTLSCNSNGLEPTMGVSYLPQGGPTPTPTASPTPNPCAVGWSEQVPYPINIDSHAIAAQGGNLYSFGGYSGSSVVSNTYKYDGNIWTALAPLPGVRFAASAVSDGANLYILNGGIIGARTAVLYRYNVAANTYTLLANPLEATELQTAAYLNGKIYRIGGYGAGGALSSVEVYDIASNIWLTDTSYPTPTYEATAVTLGGYIYVMGGTDGSGSATAKTYRFNPATHSWEDGAISDLPIARTGGVAGVVNGQIVLAGGYMSGGPTTSSITWDPATNWSSLPDMVAPRYHSAGDTLGNALFVVGGDAGFRSHNDNQRYTTNGCTSPTPQPSNTPGGPTNTPAPTNTPGGPTPTDCANPFVDVSGNIFYPAIHYLYCRGVVNGTDPTHYSPAGTSTRGQFAKVVVLGFGTPFYTPGTPDFTDVPPNYFAYLYIESGFHAGILSGFDAAGCTAHGATYPCYLPNLPITRAQLTKLVVNAAHYPPFTPTGGGQTFNDVPNTNIFYVSIETAHNKGVINGYPDGTFKPNNNIRRDEMAQIVYKGVTTP
ncbi:MAG: hypothetical protein DLM69_11470 [Candidatus Chloroheliales bacterium]|nr:MAG: hypothetical protein DLM69_11470 [Chloroflexota bacterium]